MHDRESLTQTQAPERPLALQIMMEISLAGVFTVATVAAAHLKLPLPFTPIPLTLQTMVVLLAGALLGPRLGALSQTGYLLLGLLGLPVLAAPSFIGPTGGYLFGFILAAIIMGYAARHEGWLALIIGTVLASLTILTCGTLWLAAWTGQSFGHAATLGLLPFLPGDALKAAAAIVLLRHLQRPLQDWLRGWRAP